MFSFRLKNPANWRLKKASSRRLQLMNMFHSDEGEKISSKIYVSISFSVLAAALGIRQCKAPSMKTRNW